MKFLRPIISLSVYKILLNLIRGRQTMETNPLEKELSKAKIVKDNFINSKIVSLNSIVEFISSSFKKPIRVQIVLPDEADLRQKKVSILSPIAIALIGYREEDKFKWRTPSGMKNMEILKVYNY